MVRRNPVALIPELALPQDQNTAVTTSSTYPRLCTTIRVLVLLAALMVVLNGCGGSSAGTINTPRPLTIISNVNSADLSVSGATITWSTDQPASSQVEYGASTSYGSSTALDSTGVRSHRVFLTGLTGGAVYHFRVKSGNANGNSVSGDFTFTTPSQPPAISNVTAGRISITGTSITWSTDQAATSLVEYGATTSYGSFTTLDSTAVTTHSVALTGLNGGTTYHFRVKSSNAHGDSVSPDNTFTTRPVTYTDVSAAPRTIAIVVHEDVNAADTSGLVTQLADAITADYAARTGVNDPVVSTMIIPSPADAAGVRSALRNVENLWGIMLIGNVPAPRANFPQGPILFDQPYRQPNCSGYEIASDGTTSYFNTVWMPKPECEKSAWLSRIYGPTDQILAFVQKDLNTRHASALLPQYSYIRAAWFGGMPDLDMSAYWINNGLYPSLADVNYITTDGSASYTAASRLQDIKQSLANGTEFVSIYVHGSPEEIMVEGSTGVPGTDYSDDIAWFTSSDLLAIPNHARVINLISCSTGDFSTPNYFAGAALFGGDTLLVVASTTMVPLSSDHEPAQVEKKYHLLADGATFADIDMVAEGVTEMFGDPTISLRSQTTGDAPILTFSTDGANFSRFHGPAADVDVPFTQASIGGAKVQQTIVLGNGGTKDLAVQVTFRPDFSGVNGQFPCSGSCGWGGGLTLVSPELWTGTCDTSLCQTVLTIAPGTTLPITFGLEPVSVSQSGTTTNLYGTTTGRFEIHTVDPYDSRLGASDPKLGRLNLYLSGNVMP